MAFRIAWSYERVLSDGTVETNQGHGAAYPSMVTTTRSGSDSMRLDELAKAWAAGKPGFEAWVEECDEGEGPSGAFTAKEA